jgi:hypothetical protein
VADCWSRGRWLETDFVVDRISEPLLAAKVPFRCLNADVTEQKLNLLKFPARLMTQTGAGTAKIVRRIPIQTELRRPGLHHALLLSAIRAFDVERFAFSHFRHFSLNREGCSPRCK